MSFAFLTDIDGTLTPARRPLESEMAEALKNLDLPFHVAAGSDLALVEPQFLQPLWEFGFRKDFEAFVSNGATRFRCSFSKGYLIEKISEFNFRHHLGETNYSALMEALDEVLTGKEFKLPDSIRIIGERIMDRGSMLNFAPIGRPKGELNEDAFDNRKRFVEFDKANRYRQRIADQLNRKLEKVVREKRLRIMFGGETSFDLVIEGNDKTNAARTLLTEGYTRIVFLGDALFPGGNDSVISDLIQNWNGAGDCPVTAIQVEGWRDTIRILQDRRWRAK